MTRYVLPGFSGLAKMITIRGEPSRGWPVLDFPPTYDSSLGNSRSAFARRELPVGATAKKSSHNRVTVMQIVLEVPEDLAQCLGQDGQALSRAALEALTLEGVRSGKLSTAQARRLLGFRTRNQVNAFLKAHGVDLSLTIQQVRQDSQSVLNSSL